MGKTVEYVRYPGGSHQAVGPFGAPPSQNEDRLVRILDFLGRHGGNRVRGATRPSWDSFPDDGERVGTDYRPESRRTWRARAELSSSP
jgi:hypothetical protein